MNESPGSQAHFLEMANKCRRLAEDQIDIRLSASLRKLADEYEAAAMAAGVNEGLKLPRTPFS